MSEKLNCETVAVSSWAVFAGLPVALWGLVGYFFMGGLCIWGLYKRRQPASWPFGILFWLSLFFVFVSIAMYVISHTFIGALCIICVATYVANFLLCGLAIADLRFVKSGPLTAVRAEVRAKLIPNSWKLVWTAKRQRWRFQMTLLPAVILKSVERPPMLLPIKPIPAVSPKRLYLLHF